MQVQKAGGDDVLLDVRDLETHFFGEDNVTRALGGISFQVNKGETLGVVGESGCGKSVTALSILRLLPKLTARTVGGEIRFHGRDLLRTLRPRDAADPRRPNRHDLPRADD